MKETWLEFFKTVVAARGPANVARELGVSPTTVSLVMSGKYGASTKKIEKKIINIYGSGGQVTCPVLGKIDPAQCVDTWERAGRIGITGGNPATMRLYKTCIKCELRNS